MNRSRRHKELADFLKTHRSRLNPEAAGLPPRPSKRRTAGLRREEVAALSGVSLAWYTYLEQGRPIRVSEQVLESIARTLQLDTDERNYLFSLTGEWLIAEPAPKEEGISPSLQYMLDDLGICPAYIFDDGWNTIAWNRMACEVFGNYDDMDRLNRNLIWRTFTDPDYRKLFLDWEPMAKRLLAQFRIYFAKYIDNPWFLTMVEELKRSSKEFSEWWKDHEVSGIPTGKKGLVHPEVGRLTLDFNNFRLAERPGWTLTVFTPDAGTDTRDKLKTLAGGTVRVTAPPG